MRNSIIMILLLAAPLLAQDWAREKVENSPRHLEWVTVEADGRKVETYVAYPERPDKAPAVLLIHEIFGHTDWFRLMADHLAGAGYVVVAPDLLSGMAPGGGGTADFASREEVRKAVGELDPEQVTGDLKAVLDYAREIPAATGDVAVAGFCWGGTETFRFATNSSDSRAYFVFYGTAPESKDALAQISGPVYGFYAENDARVNSTLERTKRLMKELDKPFYPKIYSGAGHGFMRAGEAPDASDENRGARAEAWERFLELLELI